MSRAPTLLVIGYVWPEPRSSAAGRHILSLASVFRDAGWRVHIASAAAPTEHSESSDSMGYDTHRIRLNCATFDQFVAELAPDAVLFDRFVTEEQFGWRVAQARPSALRLLDTEDLHCLRLSRQRAVRRGDRWTPQSMWGSALFRELAAILRSDLTLLISPYERDLVLGWGVPESLVHHTPFLVLPTEVTPGPNPRPPGFVTIGNIRHQPNWDSLQQLHQLLWPPIRRMLPTAQMHVYGSYTPKKATALHAPERGFFVHGRAERVEDVLFAHRVLLAPLRFGAGLKGKLMDAMRCGLPSVTTSIGAEGMIPPEAQWPGAIADTPEQMAQAAVHLHEDPTAWLTAHKAANDVVIRQYDCATHAHQLLSRVEAIRNDLSAHRQKNLLGAMLQHHLHRSTEYFSRWLEQKEAATKPAPDLGE